MFLSEELKKPVSLVSHLLMSQFKTNLALRGQPSHNWKCVGKAHVEWSLSPLWCEYENIDPANLTFQDIILLPLFALTTKQLPTHWSCHLLYFRSFASALLTTRSSSSCSLYPQILHLPIFLYPWGGSRLPPTNPWSSRCCTFPLWHLLCAAIYLFTVSWLSGIQKVLKAAAIRLRWEPAHGEFLYLFVCDLSCFFLKNYLFFTFEHQALTGELAYVGLPHSCVNHLVESVIPVYFLACCSSTLIFLHFCCLRDPALLHM